MKPSDLLAKAERHLLDYGWVSLRQFAALVGVSYPAIMRMREQDKFVYIEVGSHYRVYREEVERFKREGNLSPNTAE